MKKFTKEERSTFSYWFAHWCAFQMVALNLHIWKFKYLFHDIEKPWLKLFTSYDNVQRIHRSHSKHHIEWLRNAGRTDKWPKLDIDALIIDNECSRFTKVSSPFTAVQYLMKKRATYQEYLSETPTDKYLNTMVSIYDMIINRALELGLS